MLFLYIIGHGATNRDAQVRFQLSGETVSRHFHQVLDAVLGLKNQYIKLPTENAPLPLEIASNPKFYPFFKDCIGAIDGTHLPVTIAEGDHAPFRNRKGTLSQNVLGVCSFDMTFQYVLAGWKGSAHDVLVLKDALKKDFQVPAGKYYLADAGYALTPQFLVPYRGVRYHLREWESSNRRPQDHKELFNLRHTSLRNVIERIFGLIKKRFPTITTPGQYDFPTQVSMAIVAIVLHNFICKTGYGVDDIEREFEADFRVARDILNEAATNVHVEPTTQERNQAAHKRDEIALAMWAQYISLLQRRGA